MFVHINKFLTFFRADWYNLLIAGVVIVSAITVLIGILKPLLFNRIPWKPLRRACLAFSNVALCFGSVAIWFAIKHLSFGIYLIHIFWIGLWVSLFKQDLALPTVAAIPCISIATFVSSYITGKILSFLPGSKWIIGA